MPKQHLPTPVFSLSVANRLPSWFQRPLTVTVLYFIGTLVLFIQSLATQRYNNFIIFRSSWDHMLHHMPLYQLYPDTYFDYFLYHPTFPILFAPLAILPVTLGLFIWLMGSAGLFLYALRQLPVAANKRYIISWLLLLELLNAIQSSQTNPIMAALMLLTVINLDRGKPMLAALFTCICFFIKGYGAITGLVFLFYDRKLTYLSYCALFGIIGTLLPLVVMSPAELLQAYHDWFKLITSPVILEDGSVRGMIYAMLHLPQQSGGIIGKTVTALAFSGLVSALYFAWKNRPLHYHWIIAGYLLLWVVLFNQSTESPTYIMAVTGAVAGLMMLPERPLSVILLGLLVLVTSLCPTDLVPSFINKVAVNYQLKALPCLLVLLYFQYYLCFTQPDDTSRQQLAV
ncbi:glycosyltransferase family 87 protein [Chitinophaga sp. 22536]|uniref:glycosyltransferase family 87 protein n=1 Tax=unclassified Chitinophaga TaxID=2619133 RepID=UPI003F85A47B